MDLCINQTGIAFRQRDLDVKMGVRIWKSLSCSAVFGVHWGPIIMDVLVDNARQLAKTEWGNKHVRTRDARACRERAAAVGPHQARGCNAPLPRDGGPHRLTD
jgi:hypothetical protein